MGLRMRYIDRPDAGVCLFIGSGDGFDHQVFSTPTPTATAELMGMGCLIGFQIY